MPIQVSGEVTLIVDRPSIEGPFRVAVRNTMNDAQSSWGASTRASPLFKTKTSRLPQLTGTNVTHVCFLGPISPDELPPGLNLFLSYGVYNAVMFAETQAELDTIEAFLEKLGDMPWEMWKLVGDEVAAGGFSPRLKRPAASRLPPSRIAAPSDLLRASSEEYQALLAVTRSRSAPYLPEIAGELDVLDHALGEKNKIASLHPVRKLQWLVNINAALSRFSSQAFAGTSPILGTECHFWTNSLLGIGLATKALLHFRRYVDKRAALAQFPARIAAYKSKAPISTSLRSFAATHPHWTSLTLPAPLAKSSTDKDAPQLPLIVCFSGRDGFKSTTFTLSAPLEVMQSANMSAWSLQTLTHELSHIFVESILAALLEDDYLDQAWSDKILAIYKSVRTPASLHEQLQEFLFFALARLEIEAQNASGSIDLASDSPRVLVQKHFHAVSELLAHIFDYLHFFQQNPASYITSIWSSWDVIPSIDARIPEYIIRSLCALHLSNLTVASGTDVSIDNLLRELRKLVDGKDQYIRLAITTLESKRDHFRTSLETRAPIIKLARALMYSPEVASIFAQTRPVSRSASKAAEIKPKTFNKNRPVDNPIRFILEHCTDKRSDPAKSLWVLTQLAFSGATDA